MQSQGTSYVGIGIFLLILGVVPALIGATLVNKQRQRPARAVGVVTGFTERRGRGVFFHPNVAFTDARGYHRTFVDDIGRTTSPYQVGQQVTVAYDPASNRPGQIAGEGRVTGPVLLCLGGALLLAGIVVAVAG